MHSDDLIDADDPTVTLTASDGSATEVGDVAVPAALVQGSSMGRYTVLGSVGEGGMGRVYKVERVRSEFSQIGALKIIRDQADPDSDIGQEMLRRFHIERQVLANINHPNIAAILDGGTTDEDPPGWREQPSGRMYLAYLRDPDGNKLCALHRG